MCCEIFCDVCHCRVLIVGDAAAAESTCDRIAWYTVAETLVVVSLSVAQIVIVRRWFQGSRGLPGGLR